MSKSKDRFIWLVEISDRKDGDYHSVTPCETQHAAYQCVVEDITEAMAYGPVSDPAYLEMCIRVESQLHERLERGDYAGLHDIYRDYTSLSYSVDMVLIQQETEPPGGVL